jgi:hypothetical protein
MSSANELLKQGKTGEVWQKCCGFIDLSLDEFMEIQYRLLMEQIVSLNGCELGRKVMGGIKPQTVEEFQKTIRPTTYEDYADFLLEQREDVLPERPITWQRTSGRSGEYPFKWVPLSERMYEELGDTMLGIMIFCACKEKGQVALQEHDKVIYNLAPRPYGAGVWAVRAQEVFPFDFIPPLEEAELMSFQERTKEGFKLALSEGIDMFFGLSSVLVAVGNQFSQGAGTSNIKGLLSSPKTLTRLLKAVVKSKLARRPLYPKDVWSLKGVVAMGTDSSIYREQVEEMWGHTPLDVYGATEANVIAVQTWDFNGMTFVPHINLLEFIPEDEYHKWNEDRNYMPEAVLLDGVKAGEKYVIMVTNLMGGPFVRYVIGDLIEITSLRNDVLDIDIPQMAFVGRIDGLIDIAGFTRMTEKTIWKALEDSGVPYADWSVRKEEIEGKPVMHMYIELKEGSVQDKAGVRKVLHEKLCDLDGDYASLESMLGLLPLEVTILPAGTFGQYMARQEAAGADLAHLKPPHMNPSDAILDALLNEVTARIPIV